MPSLLDLLSGVGNVLDTPGSIVRGLLAGEGGRALSGILDPSHRVSGRDMLDKWGVTNSDSGTLGDIGGFAAQVATDPLTFLGGSLARGLVGRNAAKASTSVGAEAALAGRAATAAEGTANTAKSGGVVTDLLGKRRNFTMMKDMEFGPEGLNARFAGGIGQGGDLKVGVDKLLDFRDAGLRGHLPFGGAYDSTTKVGAVFPEAGQAAQMVGRHEAMHGLIHEAIQSGDTSGLGIVAKLAAKAESNSNPTISAIGQLLNETAANAVGSAAKRGGRGLVNQLTGMAKFLNNPQSHYAELAMQKSPLAANLYVQRALPKSLAYGAGAGAGLGGGALLSSLSRE